ncbi:MAG: hypothetical protein Q8O25_13150 [Sulfurisoma sp.]|nr:hypothetical protein [Sulfurisoma sp.]
MIPELFQSADTFRDRFEQGLVELPRTTGELGEDIPVIANANFEPRIWERPQGELRTCFARLAAGLATAGGFPLASEAEFERLRPEDVTAQIAAVNPRAGE